MSFIFILFSLNFKKLRDLSHMKGREEAIADGYDSDGFDGPHVPPIVKTVDLDDNNNNIVPTSTVPLPGTEEVSALTKNDNNSNEEEISAGFGKFQILTDKEIDSMQLGLLQLRYQLKF